MCGRYVSPEERALENAFRLVRKPWQFPVSYNVAPSQQVPVVRVREGEREGLTMRWGLVPFFAKGVPGKYSTINARVETIETSPSYRGPWKRAQRCILPAMGFYEWHLNADGSKQPFYIHLNDQDVFGFAGLWDRSETTDGNVLESCTVITMPPNPLMAEIHNTKGRMPAILSSEQHDAWLSGSLEQARAALQPYPAEHMVAHPVSTRVNTPKNNDGKLIEEVKV
jgi:putative SOS response-associated peptidase YedK